MGVGRFPLFETVAARKRRTIHGSRKTRKGVEDMRVEASTRRIIYRYAVAAILMIALAGMYSHFSPGSSMAAEDSLLSGRVVSPSGQPLPGIPVRVHRQNSYIAVNVYNNSRCDY